MPKKASTRKNPQQAAAEAESAAAEAEPAAEEPEPAPALADVQFTGPTADVLVRILAAVESQKVGLEDLADQNKTLLGRVAALEVKEAAAPAVAKPEPEHWHWRRNRHRSRCPVTPSRTRSSRSCCSVLISSRRSSRRSRSRKTLTTTSTTSRTTRAVA